MSMKKFGSSIVSLLLVLCMLIGMVPMSVFAAEEDTALENALAEAKAYIDGLTINNTSNDPATVVKNFGTHFTWDNEKREGSKSYLFDWSYYNGVVFEGLLYAYEATGEQVYLDYVKEYMSSLINANGGWEKCANNSSKTRAGYVNYHGADCYKTASMLLDMFVLTGDARYLTMAGTLYEDLNNAEENSITYNSSTGEVTLNTSGTELLSGAGYNFGHTWNSPSDPELWLDGLYMILPFRAEYAKYSKDTAELEQIVSRMQWVSDNMYNEDTKLFYHAADADEVSNTYWLRSMGWYAAALVDVMDSLEGDNLTAVQTQFKKLIDGLKGYQRSSGLWSNAVNGTVNTGNNREETSGTALVSYAILKAIRNGWLDESYAEIAVDAFKGICTNYLNNNVLTNICFKGAPGSTSNFNYDNEGKGVGPFIMLYAEILKYQDAVVSISVTPPTVTEYEIGEELNTEGMAVTGTTRKGETVAISEVYIDDVDMSTAGEKTVTVYYGKLTGTFTITVNEPAPVEPTPEPTLAPETEAKDEEQNVTVKGYGVTAVTAVPVAAADVAEKIAALFETAEEKVVAFDITVEGHTEGQPAEVTIPMPAGADASRFGVCYVGENGLEPMSGHPNADGTYTFTTTHFSTYVGGEFDSSKIVDEDTGYLSATTTKTVYVLTNSISSGNSYLIANSNSASNTTRYLLANNGGEVDSTSVTIKSGDVDGDGDTDTYIELDDVTDELWEVTNSYRFENDGYYLGYTTSGNWNPTYTFGLSTTARTWSYSSNRLSVSVSSWGNSTTYYLRYNDGWEWTNSSNASGRDVYFYVPAEVEVSSGGNGAEVTFAASVQDNSIEPNASTEIAARVTVADGDTTTTYDLDDCTITWASSDSTKATVSNGTVTGVADADEVIITATLSAVNGTKLKENIVLTIPVTVQSKTVVSGTLTGNTPVTTKLNVKPDFSNIKLTVTYSDGTIGVITTENGLQITDYDIANTGVYTAKISYGGKEYGTVRVTVEGNPYAGKEEATTYPEYPADGAVRIDKHAKELDFASTGLVEIELDVAGVSVVQNVDVVLVADISNSMAWKAGEKNTSPGTGETTKWQDLQAAAGSFIDTLLVEEDGSPTKNTVSFVMFGGYDAQRNANSGNYSGYFDATQTVFTSLTDAESAKSQINAYSITGNDSDGYEAKKNGNGIGTPQGGTNYDYAFLEAAAAIKQIKADYAAANDGDSYDASGRTVYVVFMTDGAPDHYNQLYYKSRTSSQFDYYALYKNSTDTIANYLTKDNLPSYAANFNQPTDNGYWLGGVSNADWITWLKSDSNAAAEAVLDIECVHSITAVGFDLEHGAFGNYSFELADLEGVLENLAGENSCDVFATADSTALKEFYTKLAQKFRPAGTSAQVNDIIDSDFTLQMSKTTGTAGKGIGIKDVSEYDRSITIKTYDLWTKAETDDNTKIGTRKGTSQNIETVIFNDEGTEAYIRTGTGTDEDPYVNSENIMTKDSDGTVTIKATYFTYTKTPEGTESFKWNIGNITDKEIALSFTAYLKGSLEGEEADGLKYTNEEATLEYIDINGKYATQIFPVPAVAWGGASTAYEFYLVNGDGKPCDRQGNEIPFPNRIIITGPYYQDLYLNQGDEEFAKEIVANKVLPAGYTLYDDSAKYTVQTASGSNIGKLTISDPAVGKQQTTILVSAVAPSYIQSRVAFGVIYNQIPLDSAFIIAPDQVVIDYGKEIVIDVNKNNTQIPSDVTAKLIGFSKYYDDVDVTKQFSNTPYSTPFEGTYGTFSLDGNKVVYEPHSFVNSVGQIFCVYEIKKSTDTYYMVSELDVIPATIMYYETDFATGVFTTNGFDEDKTDGTTADGPQDDGTVGQNTYGYDKSYDNDAKLSNASSEFAKGAGVKATTVTFSFTGTGFDLISRTGADQGLIKVQVATDAKMSNIVKTVSVLNKSESNLELYQIPVVSINGLGYGTYYVKIGVDVAYTNNTGIPALDGLKRGNEFYFDAIRVYDPAKGNATAEAAYAADGEANATLDEVRALLLTAEDADAITEGPQTGAFFIDRTKTDVEIATYETIGPNNEVYLSKDQAVAFKVSADVTPASFDLGVKSIKGDTAGLKVVVQNADGSKSWTVTKSVASSTVQFIDLLKADENSTAADKSVFGQDAYVVITNTADAVLSITDLKTAFGNASGAAEVDFTVDETVLPVAARILTDAPNTDTPETDEPEVDVPEIEEPEVIEANYDILSASFDDETVQTMRTTTMTVVTTQDVAKLRVRGGLWNTGMKYVDNEDGTRTWTVTFWVIPTGNQRVTVTGYGADGTAGKPMTASVKVKLF